MNKSFFIIPLILLIIIYTSCVFMINLKSEKNEITKENMEYEKYLNKQILGTELASLISKVVNQNEINNVLKDEKGYYCRAH